MHLKLWHLEVQFGGGGGRFLVNRQGGMSGVATQPVAVMSCGQPLLLQYVRCTSDMSAERRIVLLAFDKARAQGKGLFP